MADGFPSYPVAQVAPFGAAIKEAEQQSQAMNPMLQLAPVVQGLRPMPWDSGDKANNDAIWQGVIAGLMQGAGINMQNDTNNRITDAATGLMLNGQMPGKGLLPGLTAAPLLRAATVSQAQNALAEDAWGKDMQAAFYGKNMDYQREMDVEKSKEAANMNVERLKAAISLLGSGDPIKAEQVKLLNPEMYNAATAVILGNGATGASAPPGKLPPTPIPTSQSEIGSWLETVGIKPEDVYMTGSEEVQALRDRPISGLDTISDTREAVSKRKEEWEADMKSEAGDINAARKVVGGFRQAIATAGDTSGYFSKLMNTLSSMTDTRPAAITGAALLNQQGLLSTKPLREGGENKSGGSISVRNIMEFMWFINSTVNSQNPERANKMIADAYEQMLRLDQTHFEFRKIAREHGLTQAQTEELYQKAMNDENLNIFIPQEDGLPTLNPIVASGKEVFKKALFDSLTPEQKADPALKAKFKKFQRS